MPFNSVLSKTLSLIIITTLILVATPTHNAQAANFTVGTAVELINAINSANSNGEVDVITLTADITLNAANNAGDPNNGLNGLPSITTDILIEGAGFTIERDPSYNCTSTHNPANDFRIMHVSSSGTLTLNDVTVSNGCANSTDPYGGAIYALGYLTIQDSTISSNKAVSGGGIFSDAGDVIVDRSTISNNTADGGGGGGIYNYEGELDIQNGSLIDNNTAGDNGGGGILFDGDDSDEFTTISYSTVSNNRVVGDDYGGGIYASDDGDTDGLLTIEYSTISGNVAELQEGGGVVSYGPTMVIMNSAIINNISLEDGDAGVGAWAPTTITNSTISGNYAVGDDSEAGAGLGTYGYPVWLYNVTITNNIMEISSYGSGGIGDWNQGGGDLHIYNSIIAGNQGGRSPDCYAATVDFDFHNIPSIITQDLIDCGPLNEGSVLNLNPQLLPLADNGGETRTHAISGNSPAIDMAGASATASDQRGIPAVGNRDLGAYEYNLSPPEVLPATGFPQGRITVLSDQPSGKAFTKTSMMLEIPTLGLNIPITGVPQSLNGWDVTWLHKSAGYLYGSAFPTWAGNTLITAHVWDALNEPGPFANLKTLQYGDQFYIHAWDQTYTYEVRESKLLLPHRVRSAFQHEDYDWVTLLTCEFYSPFSGKYIFRRAVRAILVNVK